LSGFVRWEVEQTRDKFRENQLSVVDDFQPVLFQFGGFYGNHDSLKFCHVGALEEIQKIIQSAFEDFRVERNNVYKIKFLNGFLGDLTIGLLLPKSRCVEVECCVKIEGPNMEDALGIYANIISDRCNHIHSTQHIFQSLVLGPTRISADRLSSESRHRLLEQIKVSTKVNRFISIIMLIEMHGEYHIGKINFSMIFKDINLNITKTYIAHDCLGYENVIFSNVEDAKIWFDQNVQEKVAEKHSDFTLRHSVLELLREENDLRAKAIILLQNFSDEISVGNAKLLHQLLKTSAFSKISSLLDCAKRILDIMEVESESKRVKLHLKEKLLEKQRSKFQQELMEFFQSEQPLHCGIVRLFRNDVDFESVVATLECVQASINHYAMKLYPELMNDMSFVYRKSSKKLLV